MKSHLYLQIISFVSRVIAMFSGIFQSLIIVNLLSTKEYGVIGLVTSIAGIAGITQHLGLAASSTKEISQAKNGNEVYHVILASLGIRFFISFPIAFVLFFFAPEIAKYYNSAELILPLRIFGGVTLIQAFQSIFNSVISGSQKFKTLFTYQVLISFVSVVLFVPFVYFYRLEGYFYALIIFNLIQTLVLAFLAFHDLKFDSKLPSKKIFIELVSKLLKISLVIYLVKIIFTAWQELPVVILGKIYPIEVLALFTFAFNLSSKLMAISDSVTDVNLPVYSKKSLESISEFFKHFEANYNILFYFISFIGISVAIWSKEILILSDLFIFFIGNIIGIPLEKNIFLRYQDSLIYFLPLLTAITFYSFINIFKSSILVPLEKLKAMTISYVILIYSTFQIFYILQKNIDSLYSMSISLALGALLSFLYIVLFVNTEYKINLLGFKKIIFLVVSFVLPVFLNNLLNVDLLIKTLLYIIYIVSILTVFKVNMVTLIRKRR